MFRKYGLPALVLGVVMSVLTPTSALAAKHVRVHEHRDHGVVVAVAPHHRYYRTYAYAYPGGYYDAYGHWHPYATPAYGFYDRYGVWHAY